MDSFAKLSLIPAYVAGPDMEKVKQFPLAEFLGFIISAKKCFDFKNRYKLVSPDIEPVVLNTINPMNSTK